MPRLLTSRCTCVRCGASTTTTTSKAPARPFSASNGISWTMTSGVPAVSSISRLRSPARGWTIAFSRSRRAASEKTIL
jgi:hypothetical protein